MKKGSTIASAIVSAFALGVGVVVPYAIGNNHASAETDYEECYYVNSNQVSMTKSEFDLLHSIGFDDYEVENMTESKFNKLMGMGFITTQKEVSIICESDDDENYASNNLSNPGGASLQSHFTAYTPNRQFEDSDDSKTMYTYVSFAKAESGYQIFVKQNICWHSNPLFRLTDIVAIKYNESNIRISNNGYDMPDAEMHVRYNCTENGVTNYIDNYYVYSDAYCRNETGEYFAFEPRLPANKDGKTYSKFFITMELAFDTNFPDLSGTTIRAFYAHQTSGLLVDVSMGLTFNIFPPSIGISVNLDPRIQPVFEKALYRYLNITFDDEWLSRC